MVRTNGKRSGRGQRIGADCRRDRAIEESSGAVDSRVKSGRFTSGKNVSREMWSSRNKILMDTDGDDVAFLSGSGAQKGDY